MLRTAYNDPEVSKLWNIIKDTTNDIKLKLITLLSESIIEKSNTMETADSISETDIFLKKFYGAWESNLSAEQLIHAIKENKSCKEPPIL